MKTVLMVGMALLLAALSGCETKENEGTNKSEFIFVNARNVSEEMNVTLRKNEALVETKMITYAGDASRDVFWNDGDELALVYTQDLPEISRIVSLQEGKIVYVAVGNAQNNDAPVLLYGPDESELSYSDARIRVLNAMPGDVRKIVINNDKETGLLGFPTLSSPLDAFVNGTTDVEIRDENDTLIRSFALDMENHTAYLMVIHEERTDPSTPQIKLLDISPDPI
jgi:hypothetical protein